MSGSLDFCVIYKNSWRGRVWWLVLLFDGELYQAKEACKLARLVSIGWRKKRDVWKLAKFTTAGENCVNPQKKLKYQAKISMIRRRDAG